MTRATPRRTRVQGSLRLRMPLMTVAMRRPWGGGGLFAAYALYPLDFDLVGGGVVEVFAVVQGGGAYSV